MLYPHRLPVRGHQDPEIRIGERILQLEPPRRLRQGRWRNVTYHPRLARALLNRRLYRIEKLRPVAPARKPPAALPPLPILT